MAIAELGEETVALQPVGDHDGTRLDGFLYERKQALRRGAHHAPHSDPANRSAAHLRANYDKCLLSDVPAPPTRLNPTDEGFVHLDRAGQTVPAKPDHRTSKLVQPRPCGSIAAQAEDSLQSRRAGAVLLTTIHQTARNQVTNDVRVSWKIVPAVTDVWCPQLPHIQSPRPVHHAWVPSQVGHTNPWGHRSRAR